MHLLAANTPSIFTISFLVLAVGLALAFEFVNGFHDTANAVATVIYTNTLKATPAVVWSGIWNLIGVLTSSGAVAYSIVALLPVELVVHVNSVAGFAMVFALLISAILWNLGTWYFGLPASSSHTLIGSIMGVGLANALMSPSASIADGINWEKAMEIGAGLLASPLVGFFCAAILLLLAKALIKNPALYQVPEGDRPPPLWIRGLLVMTCTGVSFAHGSNDGQKGMGLIMLILAGILPSVYALKMDTPSDAINELAVSAQTMSAFFADRANGTKVPPQEDEKIVSAYLKPSGKLSDRTYAALSSQLSRIASELGNISTFHDFPEAQRNAARTDMYLVSAAITRMNKSGQLANPSAMPHARTLGEKAGDLKKAISEWITYGQTHQTEDVPAPPEAAAGVAFSRNADKTTKFVPPWVKYSVAVALGLGTMIGYKRIVVTVGEKIGKSHLTYAQGASAELVAMLTILAADHFGLPVSTTHVLSSGLAGTMAANGSGLQARTVRNIVLAWVLTLPVCVFLGALLFSLSLNALFLAGIAHR